MTIDLDSLFGLPLKFQEGLKSLDSIFIENRFLEDFEDNEYVNELIFDINEFCLENDIIGYHYTRALANDFKEKGMLIRTGEEIRNEFKERFFNLFSKKEQIQIEYAWNSRFGKGNIEYRDNLIFFNFTLFALNMGTAKLLLKYYGGEQVYAPLYELPVIGEKLNKIGSPLILKCKLKTKNLKTYIENPWGKIIVSSYHRTKNNKAHTIDQDGNQRVPVNSENIEIIKLNKHYC
jgi:hypothetical protein